MKNIYPKKNTQLFEKKMVSIKLGVISKKNLKKYTVVLLMKKKKLSFWSDLSGNMIIELIIDIKTINSFIGLTRCK